MITYHQKCKIVPISGKDSYGKPIHSEPISINCRIKEKYQLVRNQASEEVTSRLEFWFPPDTEIKILDEIEYGKKHSIISIVPKRNTLGEVVRKVVFC